MARQTLYVLARDGGDAPTGAIAGGGATVVVVTGGIVAAVDAPNYTAPLIALVGAVFVAVLTAITTNRRQREQLDAEQRRLREQLAHERDLRELEHLRAFFDEVADTFEHALTAARNYHATLVKKPFSPEDAIAQSASTADHRVALSGAVRRLTLRFAVDHPITKVLAECSRAYQDRDDAMDELRDTGTTLDDQSIGSARVMGAWRSFVDLVREELERRAAVAL